MADGLAVLTLSKPERRNAPSTQVELDRPAASEFAGEVMVEDMRPNDAREGIDAVLNRRAPTWSGS
jgi:hypothetical protein